LRCRSTVRGRGSPARWAGFACLLALALAGVASGQTYTVLKSFGVVTNATGYSPQGPLVQGSDGTLYGTASEGERPVAGTVFALGSGGTGFRVLKWFTNSVEGASPCGGLVLSDGMLYGATSSGGVSNCGTLFRVSTDGSGYTVLRSFAGMDGASPNGGLALWGGMLYGTAASGGESGNGVIFRVRTDGSGYTVLWNFSGPDGAGPNGGLTLSGSTLYGTAPYGNSSGWGVVFRINTDGSGYGVLKGFNLSDGARPNGGLVLADNALYGTAHNGGASQDGVVFKVNTDGSGYTVLKDFNDQDGQGPCAGLVLAEGTLYGTTIGGSSLNWGAIFKLNTDGSGYAVLKQFAGSDGGWPETGLLLAGDTLYGTTPTGGLSDGVVFKMSTDGSGYSVLGNFGPCDGQAPDGGLALGGNTLYGTTRNGGSGDSGTVFKVNTDGSDYAVLKDFTGSDGMAPGGNLVLVGGTLYGATSIGVSDRGLVFKVSTDGTGYAVLTRFPGVGVSGAAAVVSDGSVLYGVTPGCSAAQDYGTVFRMNTDGSGYQVLKSFTHSDGAYPNGLLLADDTLYGTTVGGSRSGLDCGVVFKVNTDGSGFTVLQDFEWSDGRNPWGGLAVADGTVYGTAMLVGNSDPGAVFEVNAEGSGYVMLKDFLGCSESYPRGLVLSGGTLFGTCDGGSAGQGAIFAMHVDGSGYQVLKSFTGKDGKAPTAGLLLASNTLYGTTSAGGDSDYGVVFSAVCLAIATSPPSQTAEIGATAGFGVEVESLAPGVVYQWFFGQTNALPGATNAFLALTNVQPQQAGAYTVVVANLGLSATSAPALLSVIAPVEKRVVPALRLTGEAGSFLHLDYIDGFGPAAQWISLSNLMLASIPQLCFDLSDSLPPHRFYRAWQTNTPSVLPAVDVAMAADLTLTGAIGTKLRIDCINQFGPTNAWVALDTITLTNTTEPYFDLAMWRQPLRLYRLVPVP